MNKNHYHVPIIQENASTVVLVEGYEINNPTAFLKAKNGEGQLTIHLTFQSNDYSPDKYTRFLNEFNLFLRNFSHM
jgi:hypothetical protein